MKEQKQYYVARAELSATDKKKRQERVREQVKKFRKQQKDKDRQAEITEKRCEATEDYNLRSSESISQSALPLIVNFNFKKGKNMARKRISRQVASAKRKINKLTEESEALKKKLYQGCTNAVLGKAKIHPPIACLSCLE